MWLNLILLKALDFANVCVYYLSVGVDKFEKIVAGKKTTNIPVNIIKNKESKINIDIRGYEVIGYNPETNRYILKEKTRMKTNQHPTLQSIEKQYTANEINKLIL